MRVELEPGGTIARKYRIVRELGRGAFGVVVEAENELTGRRVAVKVLAMLDPDERTAARFLREARHAARLVHPHVVAMIDADRDPDTGGLYLVQELLVGEDLLRLLRREGALPPLRARAILVPVMDALSAAHAAGLVHRDVKPSNVFLSQRGQDVIPKLIDFGLTKSFVQQDGDTTQTGFIVGTPSHMSPEQIVAPKEVGPQTDVWSMGVVWYEALSGRLPFEGEGIADFAFRITQRPAPALATRAPHVPAPLAVAVDRALDRDRARRWATMDEFLAAIEHALVRPAAFDASIEVSLDDLDVELIDDDATMMGSRAALRPPGPGARRLRIGLVGAAERSAPSALTQAVGAYLRSEIALLRHASHAEVVEALAQGEVDVAWLSPVAFARALARGVARGIARVEVEDADDYACVVIGHRERAPQLDAFTLIGTRAAWVDAWSAAGYAMARAALRDAGIEPEQTFLVQQFVGSYEAVLGALRDGTADVGAIYAYLDARGRVASHGASSDRSIVVLASSSAIPPDVVAVRSDLRGHEANEVMERLRGLVLAPDDPLRVVTGASSFGDFDGGPYEALRVALDGE